MGVILIYDWDYFHYPHVIPNLECAKLAAYQKKHKNITVFNDKLIPEQYTKVYIRKEYDDGVFDKRLLLPNVHYGGRAFSQIYQPFDEEFEQIEPDFEIYQRFIKYYGPLKNDAQQMKTLLYATHARLSCDGINIDPFPFERLRPRHPCVVLHDYDLAAIPNAYDFIQEISHSRPRDLLYRIGNKYPIQTYTYDDLYKWLSVFPMGNCFYLQYNGVFTDEEIIELVQNPTMSFRQLVYNFTYNCQDENDFIINVLPQIYKQALFLRKNKQKIVLNIDTDFFQTPELLNLMKLINCFYGKTFFEWFVPKERTLYSYCSCKRVAIIDAAPWSKMIVSKDQMRESFNYIRAHNYEVFDMFYSMPEVIAKGGKLVNEWEGRNSNYN